MISFQIAPHSIHPNVEVIEIFDGNILLGVIYPGSSVIKRNDLAIRIISKFIEGSEAVLRFDKIEVSRT